MKDLKNYTSALQDVGLDSIPSRDENGNYHWSNGQLEILNQQVYHDIRKNQIRLQQLDKSVHALSADILAYESPVQVLEKEGDALLEVDQDAIEEQRLQLDQYKSMLYQLDHDMLVRGYIPPENEEEKESNTIPAKPKRQRISIREILGFLSVWLIGEVFMTYVQWNTLRDGKGIEDMIIRSISLGVVLFLIHLVGRHFKRDRRPVQLIFLIFSFLMLFTMLLAPLLIREAYPPLDPGESITSPWSLNGSEESISTGSTDSYPFWINFYRNNDMLPGILVFLCFVIMQTFSRPVKKDDKPQPVPHTSDSGEFTQTDGKMQIEEKRKYYRLRIARAEEQLTSLTRKQADVMSPNTAKLQQILEILQKKQEQLIDMQHKKDDLNAMIDHLVRSLELQLNRYRTEYTNVLTNNQVKSVVVRPLWPSRQDIRNYFNLS